MPLAVEAAAAREAASREEAAMNGLQPRDAFVRVDHGVLIPVVFDANSRTVIPVTKT